MPFALNQLGQIALPVTDIDRAETFYGTTLGLRRLYRFGDLTFFDCAGGCCWKGHAASFFTDPDGHTLALMQEAPKGYAPPA